MTISRSSLQNFDDLSKHTKVSIVFEALAKSFGLSTLEFRFLTESDFLWCTCDGPETVVEASECSCPVTTIHTHCTDCGKVSRIDFDFTLEGE